MIPPTNDTEFNSKIKDLKHLVEIKSHETHQAMLQKIIELNEDFTEKTSRAKKEAIGIFFLISVLLGIAGYLGLPQLASQQVLQDTTVKPAVENIKTLKNNSQAMHDEINEYREKVKTGMFKPVRITPQGDRWAWEIFTDHKGRLTHPDLTFKIDSIAPSRVLVIFSGQWAYDGDDLNHAYININIEANENNFNHVSFNDYPPRQDGGRIQFEAFEIFRILDLKKGSNEISVVVSKKDDRSDNQPMPKGNWEIRSMSLTAYEF